MTSAHLTSNSMLCDNNFLCPRTLFSSPISSWLGSPQPREATKLSLFQRPGVHKEPELGQNHQSHLLCCLDNTSPRPASTSISAVASGYSMSRLRRRSCVTLLVSTKRTVEFHSQVTLPLKMCSQMHHWFSLSSQSPLKTCCKCTVDFPSQVSQHSRCACKCTIDFHSQVTSLLISPIRKGSPLWHGSLFVVQSSCSCKPNTAITCHEFCAQNAHCGLGFACGAVSAQVLQHILRDWVALYSFLSCWWRKFLLEWARPCYEVPP